MKLYVKANEELYESGMPDSIDGLAFAISKYFGVPVSAARIVATWYSYEGVLSDFEYVEDFLDYMRSDLRDMLDAASDIDEIKEVGEAFGLDVSHILGAEDDFDM